MSITSLLFLILVSTSAHAQPMTSSEAEARRIETEITALAERNAWQGVDRYYNTMVKKDLLPSTEATKLAATAAMRVGNTWAAYQRFFRALQHDKEANVGVQLRTIRSQYGRVEIRRNSTNPATLVEKARSFDPNHNACLAFSKEVLQTTGGFDGMLPIGEYTVNGTVFTVRSGLRATIISL